MTSPFRKPQKSESALTQKSLVAMIKDKFANLTDERTGKNTQYEVSDAAISAFAVFFLQNPSFLAQQIALQVNSGKNNLQTLFGSYKNPSDNQIRNLLDAVSPTELYSIFPYIFNKLYAMDYFKSFKVLDNSLAVTVDGFEYFSSDKIHCDCCSTQKFANGRIRYSHKMLAAAVVSPKQSNVIPLAPEFIAPQDGHDKQDCELSAANRWLQREGPGLSAHNITILGDDLFSHQPFCEAVKAQNMHFILVCKDSSHPTLQEWRTDFEREGKVETITKVRWNGRQRIYDHYRLMNHLPLRDGDDAMMVNWCELKSMRDDGKVLYFNDFITDYPLSTVNVVDIVEVGRSRWKIENENNNTLKTKGYHFEHNFGHGKRNLSSVLATLILLAFLFHTVLEHIDKYYQLLRSKLPNRKMFFDDVRALTRYMCFESWHQMLEFMLRGLEIPIPESA